MRGHLCAAAAFLCATGATSSLAETPAERGAYLAAIAGCVECHTPRKPGAPILSGGTEFGKGPSAAISANLTPDRQTGLGAWSDAQITAAIRDGLRPDGSRIGAPMPQRAYSGLTPNDLAALVAFLKSVPPVHHDVRPTAERRPSSPAATFARDPSASAGRGAYLFAVIMHCSDCHGPVGDHQTAPPRVFAGTSGPVTAPHLTMQLLAGYSDATLAALITRGIRADGSKIKGPMPTSAYAHLTSEDLAALLTYLRFKKTETR